MFTYINKQWPAVRTTFGVIRLPPQKCNRLKARLRDTWFAKINNYFLSTKFVLN